MCGIGGFVGEHDDNLCRRMISRLSHRGPDGQGAWEDAQLGIGLCHTRLSILDLTDAAAQPMRSPDGRFIIVYNGEIYNFKELRDQLSSKGVTFRSTGDTEVLLHGLAVEGESFVN